MSPTVLEASRFSIEGQSPSSETQGGAPSWSWLKIFAIAIAVYWLGGWTLGLDNWLFLAMCLVVAHSVVFRARHPAADGSLPFGLWLGLCVAVAALVAILFQWNAAEGLGLDEMALAMFLGLLIADSVEASRLIARTEIARDALVDAIAAPVKIDRPKDVGIVDFYPHWVFKDRSDPVVWAIDPALRAVRAMRPRPAGTDHVFVWNATIESIELRRLQSRILGERDLHILSRDETGNAWSITLHFAGNDKTKALHWRDTFESWRQQDRAVAMAAAR